MAASNFVDGPDENYDSLNQQTSGEYLSSFNEFGGAPQNQAKLYAQAPVYQHTNYYSQQQSEELSSYVESSFTSDSRDESHLSQSSYSQSFAYRPNVTNAINPVDETGFTRGSSYPPKFFPHQYLQASTTSPAGVDETFSSNTSMSSSQRMNY